MVLDVLNAHARRILFPCLQTRRGKIAALLCAVTLAGLILLPQLAIAQISSAVKGTGCDIDVAENTYVVNAERCTITRCDQNLKAVTEIGGPGWEPGYFDRPMGIWARNGLDIYVADYGNHRIQRFDRTLSFVSQLYTRDSDNPEERFGYPTDVGLSRMGELYICDTENGRILKLNRQNQVQTSFGGIGGGKGRLLAPTRLEIGPADNVYVLDSPRIAIFDAFGNFLRELYLPVEGTPRDIFGTEEYFLVLIDGLINCFDSADRPIGSLNLSSVAELHGMEVNAIAATRTRLILLTRDELIALPNPFSAAGEGGSTVERDQKND